MVFAGILSTLHISSTGSVINIQDTNIGTLTFDDAEEQVGEITSAFRGESIAIKPDKTRIYLGGRRGGNNSAPSNIYQYTLNSAFDFSNKKIQFVNLGFLGRGLAFSDDGTKVFYSDGSGVSGQTVVTGTLGTAWDISTLGSLTSKSFSSVPGLGIEGIEFTGATPGTEFIIASFNGNIHYQNLSTPYDLTSNTEPMNTLDYKSILTTLGFEFEALREIRITAGGRIAIVLHTTRYQPSETSYLLEYSLNPAYDISSISASSFISSKDVGRLIQDNISGIGDTTRTLCRGLAVDTDYSSGNYVYVHMRKTNGNETISRLKLNDVSAP